MWGIQAVRGRFVIICELIQAPMSYCQLLWTVSIELGGGLVETEAVLEDDSLDDVG